MKKLYILFCLLISFAFVGCSDTEEQVASLSVIESDISYDSMGGVGNIKVSTLNTVTASSTEQWCTIDAINDNVITIKVEPNYSESSRSAMINIQSGDESTQVPIYQIGSILDTNLADMNVSKDGGNIDFIIKSNGDIDITSSADWLTFTYEEEKLTLKILPLLSGTETYERVAVLKVVSGKSEFEYSFTQVNMEGTFTCTCLEDGGPKTYTCRLEETETPMVYNVIPQGSFFDAPYKVTYSNKSIIIGFNQILGLWEGGPKKMILCAFDKAGTLTWDKSVQYVAPVEFDSNSGKMVLKFRDNGTWSGQKVDGFYYSLSDDNGTPTGTGYYSTDIVWIRN